MIKGYEKYIKTSVECFGDIPNHWNSLMLRYVLKYEKGKNASIYTKEFLADNIGEIPVYSGQTSNEGIMGYTNRIDYTLPIGLLVTTVGAKAMTVRKVSNEFCLSQNCALITEKNPDVNLDYYKYALEILFDYEKNKLADIIQPSLRFEDLDRYRIILPPLTEQSQIARFLDHQTSLIDEIINRKEKQIELLKEKRQAIINETVTKGLNPDAKMKDSGIEWLGEIPEHWRLSKVKYEFYLKARVGWKGLTSDEFEEESYAYLVTGTDFKQRNINWKTCYQVNKERYEDDPFIILKNGDLLITKDGTIGKTSIVKDLDKPACLNSGIFVLRPLKNNVNNEFLYWIMNSSSFSIFNDLTSTGATIKHLYQNVFQEFSISIPHIEEQNEIVEYLDKQTAFVDNIIEQTVYQITKIKEYRQSIISEAVTGKIDVRDWQPNNSSN